MASQIRYTESFGVELGPRAVMDGDFYHEPDNVTRGLTLPLGSQFAFQHGKERSSAGVRFQITDAAMPLTPELAKYLSPSTMRISNSSPIRIGNHLLDLLDSLGAEAHICKVNRGKNTIKAEIFSDGLDCVAKIRLHLQGQTCIVEFQRYSGDAVGFSRFYRKADAYLQSAMNSTPLRSDH